MDFGRAVLFIFDGSVVHSFRLDRSQGLFRGDNVGVSAVFMYEAFGRDVVTNVLLGVSREVFAYAIDGPVFR